MIKKVINMLLLILLICNSIVVQAEDGQSQIVIKPGESYERENIIIASRYNHRYNSDSSDNGLLSKAVSINNAITKDILAHYEFESDTKDSSANKYHGTVHGNAVYTDGVIGKAIKLSSADDYVGVDKEINLEDEFTVSFWVRLERKAGDFNMFIQGANKSEDNVLNLSWRNSDEKFECYLNGNKKYSSKRYNLLNNKWNLITYSNKNGIVKLYIDGVLFHTYDFTSVNQNMDIEYLVIGKDQDSLGGDFQDDQSLFGELDDIRIYKSSLSEDEITNLYRIIDGVGKAQVAEKVVDTAANAITTTAKQKIKVNGRDFYLDSEPIKRAEKVMYPLSTMLQVLGFDHTWDETQKSITASNGINDISLKVGTKHMSVDGKNVSMEFPPVLENEKVFVPVESFAQALGADIRYDKNENCYILDYHTMVIFPGEVVNLLDAIEGAEGYESFAASVTRLGDFEYSNMFSEVSGKLFYRGNETKLSVPGRYEVVLKGAEKSSGARKEINKLYIKVTDPVVFDEVRYLPESDSVYIRADIHALIGQKNENEWPIVWVGVFDTIGKEWLYLKPDANNTLTHLKFNTYEMYFPASKLHRIDKLKFMPFVDGYNVPASVEFADTSELAITPLPKYAWNIRYNWVTDELEALADPDIKKSKSTMPDVYINIYDENNKPLYKVKDVNSKVPLYGGDDSRYKNKYFRSWSLKELNLDRGKTYKACMIAEGFEVQAPMSMLTPVAVDTPSITLFSPSYSNSEKTVAIRVKTKGVPATYNVVLSRDGYDKNIPVLTQRSYENQPMADYYLEAGIGELNMNPGSSYTLNVRVFDSKNNYTGCSASQKITLTIPQTQEPKNEVKKEKSKAIGDLGPYYIAYSYDNKTFDPKEEYGFEDRQLELALESAQDPYFYYNNIYKESGRYMGNAFKGMADLIVWDDWDYFDKLTESKLRALYKDEIRRMIKTSLNSPGFKEALAKTIEEDKRIVDDVLKAAGYTVDSASELQSIRIKDLEKRALNVESAKGLFSRIESAKRVCKGVDIALMGVDYIPVLLAEEKIDAEMLAVFGTIANDNINGDKKVTEFSKAFDDIHFEYLDSSEKFNAGMEILSGQLSGLSVDAIASKVIAVAGIKLGVDLALEYSGANYLLDSLNRTIANAYIQRLAEDAYQYYRKKHGESIKDTGLVYLAASRSAYEYWNKFMNKMIEIGEEPAGSILHTAIDYNKNKIKNIDTALYKWLTKAELH